MINKNKKKVMKMEIKTSKTDLTTTEVAREIRKELKLKFKGCKFSVVTSNYSGGSSITIALMESDFRVTVEDEDYIQVNQYYINDSDHLTAEGKKLMERVMEIVNKYHWDESDSQADYFFCNFYVHLHVGKWDKHFKNPINEEVVNHIEKKDVVESLMVREVEVKYKGKAVEMDKADCPEAVWDLLSPIVENETVEHFFVIFLNNKNQIHGWQKISTGTVTESLVHPREVFQGALLTNSSSIIVAHNHPSGHLDISTQDKKTTSRLVEAGKLLGIPILDHVIIGDNSYLSMREENLI
jgi:DNA repair protein RadC